MAKKGRSRHLKRYAAPRALKLPRKSYPWVAKPIPGPHPLGSSLPLRVVLRDYLSLAKNAKEADKALAERRVIVDGKRRSDPKFPLGLMDVLQLPDLDRAYRVLLDHRERLILREIDQAETSMKICKVVRKKIVKGNKVQLAFHDGKTLVGDLKGIKPGDCVKLALPKLEILEHFPLEKGYVALVTRGKNAGRVGKIIDIGSTTGPQPNLVTLEADGETFQAPEHYVFVVGEEKPVIALSRAPS